MARGWFGNKEGHRKAGRLGGLARRKNRRKSEDGEQNAEEQISQ